MTAIEKTVCSSSQEEGAPHEEPHEEGPGLVRRQREQVNGEQEPLLGFLLVRQVSRLNMASLNNFSGLWVIGAVPSCLVPGPGVIRAGGQWPEV